MEAQIVMKTNWTLIISIVVGSGVLAYVGDVLGFKYGKQRISLFGLRPKYTSRLITAFTGTFISVVVLTVMSLVSENVRGALVTLDSLQRQIEVLNEQLTVRNADLVKAREELDALQPLLQATTVSLDMARFDLENLRNDRDLLFNERNDLQAEVNSLREDSAELERELEIRRLGTITVQANALLAQRAVSPDATPSRVRESLDALYSDARTAIADRRSEKQYTLPEEVKLIVDPAEESAILEELANSSDRFYIRALAAENIAVDEEAKIHLESSRSYLLYDEGEILYRKLIDPEERNFNAEETLHVFLRELRNEAIKNGVIADPATNSVGSLEGEDFFEVVEKLKLVDVPTIINGVALQDIYTEGPVRIKIVLE